MRLINNAPIKSLSQDKGGRGPGNIRRTKETQGPGEKGIPPSDRTLTKGGQTAKSPKNLHFWNQQKKR